MNGTKHSNGNEVTTAEFEAFKRNDEVEDNMDRLQRLVNEHREKLKATEEQK